MRGFIKISTKRSRTKVCGLPLPAADIRVIREWKLVFYLESGNTLPEDKNAFPWTKEAHHIDRKGMKTKKETKDEIRLFKVPFCGGSSLLSTSLNWEIRGLESALSRCLWRYFLRGLQPKTLLEWGLTISWAGDLETIKQRKRALPVGESSLSLSPPPLLPPITSLFPVCYEVSNSAPPYGFLISNIAVVVRISTSWKPWNLRNHEPKQILLAWGAWEKKCPTNTFLLCLEDKVKKTEQQEK